MGQYVDVLATASKSLRLKSMPMMNGNRVTKLVTTVLRMAIGMLRSGRGISSAMCTIASRQLKPLSVASLSV